MEEAEESITAFFSTESDLSDLPPDFDHQSAYNRIASYVSKDQDDLTKAVLTSFLDFLPEDGRAMLTERILPSIDDELYCLCQHLTTSILTPMKARSATPPITPLPFEDFPEELEITASTMDESPTRNIQRFLKWVCLRRDAFRCLATGLPERKAVKANLVSLAPSSYPCHTKMAHIIPFAIGHWGNQEQDTKVSQIWTTLRKCFPHIGLRPQDVNHLTNLMTLDASVHKEFGSFNITFEATGNPNEYYILMFESDIVATYLPQPDIYGNRTVTFQSHTDAPLPSPRALEVHCALAKILHASGMSERIDKLLEDKEDTKCLANDGSSDARTLLFAF